MNYDVIDNWLCIINIKHKGYVDMNFIKKNRLLKKINGIIVNNKIRVLYKKIDIEIK